MKWLFIFPALIAASWVVMASQSALAFGLAQGVIVDGKGSVVYLMNPVGGIDAVDLSGGAVLATTTRGAKPFVSGSLSRRIHDRVAIVGIDVGISDFRFNLSS